MSKLRNGMALVALILGIVGTVAGLIPFLFIVAWGSGAVGVVRGGFGLQRAIDHGAPGRGQALAGMLLSGLAIVLGIAGFAIIDNLLT